ncbi:MAG: polysaccharide deacetylase family protein [Gammaproteobacteria bacterium]|nr:polysaccharide deacetylase family protein [Gammaproteobacteria bacterium]
MLHPIKRTVKRGLQHFAARFGRHTRIYEAPQLLILMYHRILPKSDSRSLTEEPGMIVTPESLRLHLEIVNEYFKTIHLSHWIESQKTATKLHGNYCAITFDDGWSDNYEFAFPILKQLNVPATIFLVSEMIGTSRLFWPERLAQLILTIAEKYPEHWSSSTLSWISDLPVSYVFNAQPPSREQLSEIIDHTKKLKDLDIHQRLDRIEQELQLTDSTPYPALLNWDHINEMVTSGIIEIGSHTCQHIRLNNMISEDLLTHEVVSSKHQIEEHTGHSVKHFCFPNGDYTPEVLKQVKSHYKGAVTTEAGWNSIFTNSHQLRRIGVHEDIAKDRTSFLARISGWM